MALTSNQKKGLGAAFVAILVIGALIVAFSPHAAQPPKKPFVLASNALRPSTETLIVTIDVNEEWQFAAAVCLIPVTIGDTAPNGTIEIGKVGTSNEGSGYYSPLFFSTGEPLPPSVQKYPNQKQLSIKELGADASSASLKIAETYWETLRTVVIAEDYAHAVQAAPIASALTAPIIYPGAGVEKALGSLGVTSAIVVGSCGRFTAFGVKSLDSPEALWEYYLGLPSIAAAGGAVDYLVVTNPYDIDFGDERLMIPGLSLTSGILAAHYHALVITGDFSIDKNWTYALGYGTSEAGTGERGEDPDEVPDELELELQTKIDEKAVAIDNAIDNATAFLSAAGQEPKYVALVGGPAAVPMMYLKSPIWYEGVQQEDKGEEYVATDSYYADRDIKLEATADFLDENFYQVDDELYTSELLTGRIIAPNLLDASALVARSVGYWGYEFKGEGAIEYFKAEIINSLMCGVSDTGAGAHQKAVFTQNQMYAEMFHPWKVVFTTYFDEVSACGQMESVNALIYDGHGYPDGWYHLWTSTHNNEEDYDRIGAEDIWDLDLSAMPVFGACCLSSALDWPSVWVGAENEQDMTPSSCMSLAFLHAGAMCYIGATEESWGAFFGGLADGDPDVWGYGDFDMPAMFWSELLKGDVPVGQAFAVAREQFFAEEWQDNSGRPFARLCLLETALYGDPGAVVYSPGMTPQ